MEKEQIISTLKEKLGQTSFSDRSLTTYVENNLPTEGTEPDDAYWTKHTSIIKSFQGQFSADVAASISSQLPAKVAEYYEKNPDKLKEYIKAHPELLTKEDPNKDKDDKYKELEEKLAKFEQEQKDRNKKVEISQIREQVYERLSKEAKEKNFSLNEKLWRRAVNATAYGESDNAETFYASAKAEYESLFKDANGDTAKPFSTMQRQLGNEGTKTVSRYFEKKKAREGWGKK